MENALVSDADANTRPDHLSPAAWAVDPRLAVRESEIICLVCNRSFRQITNTHLRSHQLTAAQYKARFGYNRRRPLMCRALLRVYAERAVRSNLASRIGRRPIVADPELRRLGGRRSMSLEERFARLEAGRRRRAMAEEARRTAMGVGRSARARRRGGGATPDVTPITKRLGKRADGRLRSS
jgi:predicted transcriptional regulator